MRFATDEPRRYGRKGGDAGGVQGEGGASAAGECCLRGEGVGVGVGEKGKGEGCGWGEKEGGG